MLKNRRFMRGAFAPLLREALPYCRRAWRLRHVLQLYRLRQLERDMHPADMRQPEVVIERLLLERAP